MYDFFANDQIDMTEHPKKRKRKTSYPSRYSDTEGTTIHVENNGIFFDHCYSVCSIKQQESKIAENEEEPASNGLCKEVSESAVLNDITFQEEVPSEAQEVEVESASPQNHEEEMKEPCATDSEISEKGQSSNTTPAHKWPLLRANSSGLFKCEQCGFNSKYFSDLKQHMVLKHKCTESHICKVCKQSFSTDDSLLEHGRLHKEELYSCKYCSYKTTAFEKLSQHIADVHFTDFLYWCEQCDLQFCTSSELYLHFQEHSCDEQYLCQFCEHETSDPEDLHSHVVNEHACRLIELSDSYNNAERGRFSLLNKISFDKSKNFFVCQACGFRSRLHTNVNRHVAIEHTRFFPHVCDDCGKGFSGMLEYSQHLNLHLSEGVFLCQYCEYSTGQLEDLKTHLDFRHSTDLPQKCNSCLMRFGSEEELKNHLQIHEST
ncbi:zinc finger protein 639 isoform X1 [Microcaecilia unicolor]|uniref:Zinc finger protein 639 isoform X1 n=2 Tax=Microcaecilia unicolor TaxID=1415580 RepID=A0A6P7Z082_9AMPH|nr:zinc finger protein 639 isoform X1 [Microcaecilia unicolor]